MANDDHPIFDDIYRGDLQAVQQRVLAEPYVLEERSYFDWTPLMCAIIQRKPAIALWLIEHRGQHDIDMQDDRGQTALHFAFDYGPLSVAQALVGAVASLSIESQLFGTPLMHASHYGQSQIVAYLLMVPAARSTINTIADGHTALSRACSSRSFTLIAQLLDVGADPTIPDGHFSPLNTAIQNGPMQIANMLRCAIRCHTLAKARALLDATLIIRKAEADAAKEDESPAHQKEKTVAAAPAYLKSRMEQAQALPQVTMAPQMAPQQQGEHISGAGGGGVCGGARG